MPSPSDPPTRDEFDAEFETVVPTLRSLRDDETTLEQPPDAIWDRIETEIGRDTVTPLSSRRRTPRWIPIAAAASFLLVVGAAIAVVLRDDATRDATVVARADLSALGTGDVVGSAQLVTVDDALQLDIVVPEDMDADTGYFELWLIDDELTEPVSLGPVEPGARSIVLPAGVDPDSHPVVDVSLEEDDGDASHSGESLVRGRLSV